MTVFLPTLGKLTPSLHCARFPLFDRNGWRIMAFGGLLKYKLHTDQELFEKAYGYLKQYYREQAEITVTSHTGEMGEMEVCTAECDAARFGRNVTAALPGK